MNELTVLGTRVAQAKGFEWRIGMCWISPTGSGIISSMEDARIAAKYKGRVPDILHPATKGALLQLIRDLTGCLVCIWYAGKEDDLEWYAEDVDYMQMAKATTEEEVYVEAMENAAGFRI